MIIREQRAEDFERLYRIDQAAFAPALAYSRTELRYYVMARRGRTLVAEVEGEVVGFVIARCMERGRGTVVTLDVAPGWQRQGVGARLLAAAEAWLSGEGVLVVSLETPADESGARQFYEKHGYRVGSRVPGYYHGRLDAFGMIKRLSEGASGPGGGRPAGARLAVLGLMVVLQGLWLDGCGQPRGGAGGAGAASAGVAGPGPAGATAAHGAAPGGGAQEAGAPAAAGGGTAPAEDPLGAAMRGAREAQARGDGKMALAWLHRARQLAPDHPRVLYALARLEATLTGQRPADAVGRLEQVVALGFGGGIPKDPAFASLRQTEGWRRLMGKVWELPVVAESRPAFTIPDSGLLPEGMAYDPATRLFYVGGQYRQKVVAVDRDGRARDFAVSGGPVRPAGLARPMGAAGAGQAGADGGAATTASMPLGMVLGMKVDPARRELVVCGTGIAPDHGGSALYRFDLASGRLASRVLVGSEDGERHLFNDLVVTASGDALVTDSTEGTVYRIPRPADRAQAATGAAAPPLPPAAAAPAAERLFPPHTFAYPNGIAMSPDERRVYVAHATGIALYEPGSDGGAGAEGASGCAAAAHALATPQAARRPRRMIILRGGRPEQAGALDPIQRTARPAGGGADAPGAGHRWLPLPHPWGTTQVGIDGLYFDRGRLVAVQNGVEPVRLIEIRLTPDGCAVASQQVLEARTPTLASPTTGALVDDFFYFMANTQGDAIDDDGRLLKPLASLAPVAVRRLQLPP